MPVWWSLLLGMMEARPTSLVVGFWFFITFYLMGSVNFSLLVAWAAGHDDLRTQGSQNAGATNALRVMGKSLAFLVVLLDLARGVLVAWGATAWLTGVSFGFGCLGLIIGNMFPIFHGFRGGKGIAAIFGLMLGLNPWVGLGGMLFWVGVVLVVGRASLGSLSAVFLFPLLLWLLGAPLQELHLALALIPVALFSHRKNLVRLLKGEEPDIRNKKSQ